VRPSPAPPRPMASASVLVCRCVPPSGMDRSLSEVVASPRRGRPSSLGGAAVETPPKTPATSHCRCVTGTLESAHALSLPYSVCDAVAKAIWSHAKAHAEGKGDTVLPANIGLASSDCSGHDRSGSPSAKRRRSTCNDLAVPDHLKAIFARCGPTQPSQTQDDQTNASSSSDDTLVHARGVLDLALVQAGVDTAVAAEILARVRAMALSASAYWREVSVDLSKAASSLYRYLEHQRLLYWRHQPWRGVNLGGWLLLEPGPSSALFDRFEGGVRCEWKLMQKMREELGAEKAAEALREHRETFITEEDIRRIRSLGLNAVRVPFGYWVVMGPANEDEFMGPCIEYLDRVLHWCKIHGLQVLLDLHGAPGGESGEKPCGRERRDWSWQDWRFDESLAALRTIATRYKGHEAVTGIAVCNEPSETVPASVLCQFYDRAVQTIRDAGMPPDEVSIMLPIYRTERLDEIWRLWNQSYDGFARHANVAFDLHLYHCFGPWWQRQGFGSHLRMTKRHRKILRRVPAVVGEWSLALPPQACGDGDVEEDEAQRAFAKAQLEAYAQASHGWFFWNWRDSPNQHPGWDVQTCVERQWLTKSQFTDASSSRKRSS